VNPNIGHALALEVPDKENVIGALLKVWVQLVEVVQVGADVGFGLKDGGEWVFVFDGVSNQREYADVVGEGVVLARGH